jgi:hypothetical protein
MSTGGSSGGAKPDLNELTILSMNVQGVNASDFCKAITTIRPDLVLTQENPSGKNHAFNKLLRTTVDDVNKPATASTTVASTSTASSTYSLSQPQLSSEWFDKNQMYINTGSRKVLRAPDASKKSYALVYNKEKIKLVKGPELVDYSVDTKFQDDVQGIRDGLDLSARGFGARPPTYMEFEQVGTSTPERIGVFNWHAPPPQDLNHRQSVEMFKKCTQLQHSLDHNHTTLFVGDINDQLNGDKLLTKFPAGTNWKYDHIRGHGYDSGTDIESEHSGVLNNLYTNLKDHKAHAVRLKRKGSGSSSQPKKKQKTTH